MGTSILAHGAGHLFTYFPLLFIGAAVYVIVTALRDGSAKKDSSRTLPTSPLGRQVFVATRRRRRSAEASVSVPSPERGFRRQGTPSLQVMEGDDGKRSRIPQTFDPPPPRKRA